MAGARSSCASGSNLSGVRVLVADDEEDVLELLDDMLSAFGIELLIARSGDDAFAKFIECRPDIVISDVQMSGGTGLDLIRSIRALPPERGGLTPAIAFSGAPTMDELFDAGFHFVLTKPASPPTLLTTIDSFVRAEELGHDTWSVGFDQNTVVVCLKGRVTGSDMRAAANVLVPLFESTSAGYHVVSDLRALTSFTPSVGAVGQLDLWSVRAKIRSVRVVGGSYLARLISRGACRAMGIPCVLAS
jgi:CheY-like chemotaxis protein